MAYHRKRPPLDPCPLEHVLAMVSGKWKARVLYLLASGELGFADIRRAVVGLRQQVLATLLQELERDGLVDRRRDDPANGSRYRLTLRGQELVGLLVPVAAWGNARLAERGLTWSLPLPGPSRRTAAI